MNRQQAGKMARILFRRRRLAETIPLLEAKLLLYLSQSREAELLLGKYLIKQNKGALLIDEVKPDNSNQRYFYFFVPTTPAIERKEETASFVTNNL